MSFEFIEGFLRIQKDYVGLDQLFVLLNNVIDEVCEFDGVTSVHELDLSDDSVRLFAQSFCRLSGVLISTYSTTKDKVNKEDEFLRDQAADNSKKIKEIDAQLNETMETIKAEEKILSELEAKKKELAERNAEFTALVDACKSALSDDFLKKNLFKAAEGSDSLSVSYPDLEIAEAHFDNFDELGQWLENINARIKGLMIVYEKQLAEIVKWAEDLTADKSDK